MEKWALYAVISMVFAGITAILAKFGMKDLSSDAALSIRTAVVFAIITANAVLIQHSFREIKQTSLNNILFLSLSGITAALSWIFYYRAVKEGQVSIVSYIDKASILITLLLSFLILKEPFTLKVLLGGSFILVGLIILAWK